MSKILRRPMFRGGRVSSYGTGIANGLTNDTPGYNQGGQVKGYNQGGQIGGGIIAGKPMGGRYGFADPKITFNKRPQREKIINEVMIEFPNETIETQLKIVNERLNDINFSGFEQAIGAVEEFNPNLDREEAKDSLYRYDSLGNVIDTLGTEFVGGTMDMIGNYVLNPVNDTVDFITGSDNFRGSKEPAYNNKRDRIDTFSNTTRDEEGNIISTNQSTTDALSSARSSAARQKVTLEKQKQDALIEARLNKIEGNEKSDEDIMKNYMDMFSEAYGTDKEALNRSRFLEIAKFGANILAQPGGQTMGEVIGQAGGPALEGMTKIEEAENQGQRQLKGIAMQAALKKMDNPTLDNLKMESKISGQSMADLINAKYRPANQSRVDQVALDTLAQDLSSVMEGSKADTNKRAAAEVLTKNGLTIKDVLFHTNPKDNSEDLIEGKIYVFTKPTGGVYAGTWNGEIFETIQ